MNCKLTHWDVCKTTFAGRRGTIMRVHLGRPVRDLLVAVGESNKPVSSRPSVPRSQWDGRIVCLTHRPMTGRLMDITPSHFRTPSDDLYSAPPVSLLSVRSPVANGRRIIIQFDANVPRRITSPKQKRSFRFLLPAVAAIITGSVPPIILAIPDGGDRQRSAASWAGANDSLVRIQPSARGFVGVRESETVTLCDHARFTQTVTTQHDPTIART